ncbi:MAG: TOBE domain-containing protein [Euryarchaeota archaeon]|nr:TOBE domain-containing protein [Euryarchaeota archaeon]
MLTKGAVEDLDLKEGDKVEAVIKATEVLILKE